MGGGGGWRRNEIREGPGMQNAQESMMDDLRGGWWWEGEKGGLKLLAHSCLDDGAIYLWKVEKVV